VKRGDIVTVALQGDYGKPRPALIAQSDLLDDEHPSVAVLPITSHLVPANYLRIDIGPEAGMLVPSQIQIDKPHTIVRGKVGAFIGHVGRDTLVAVDRAMMLFFGLA
jgi:mRNA interferase MazF